ncbi:MAG TPA: FlgD immunoglobulin-like domain containing protein, partial [bacterium]|nr:FlgD immunoglobulin-like domain containing protein [bacterium]
VQHASTQEPGQGTLLNAEFQLLQGQRAVQETYTFAEPVVLVIRDDLGNAPAVTEVITVSPGPPAALLLTADPGWVRGNRHATVSGQVVDAWGNGVPDQPVDFEMLEGTGTLTPIDALTGADGAARADFLSPRRPEIAVIRGTSNLLSAELDLETALVDPAQAPGYVTNYPNPFHPNEAPTTIAYKLAADARVTLKIYSLSGFEVVNEEIEMGTPGGREGLNEFQWDGRNGKNRLVASGGYVLVLQADRNGETIHTLRRRIAVVR